VKALVSDAEAAVIARQAQRGQALAYRVVQAHWAYQRYRTVQLKRLLRAAVGAWRRYGHRPDVVVLDIRL
jgi:hypothetical protein